MAHRGRGDVHPKLLDKVDGAPQTQLASEPEKACFEPSGLLASVSNKHNEVTLKYCEPSESRVSDVECHLYVFNGEKMETSFCLDQKPWYLIGRDPKVCDILVTNKSCSKQHCVIQFRQLDVQDKFGSTKSSIKPYVMDLDSSRGTFLNEHRIPDSCFVELQNKDVIRLGSSSREYVFMSGTG